MCLPFIYWERFVLSSVAMTHNYNSSRLTGQTLDYWILFPSFWIIKGRYGPRNCLRDVFVYILTSLKSKKSQIPLNIRDQRCLSGSESSEFRNDFLQPVVALAAHTRRGRCTSWTNNDSACRRGRTAWHLVRKVRLFISIVQRLVSAELSPPLQ